MSRKGALTRAEAYFDDGKLFDDLARRVAHPTESQEETRSAELRAYLTEEMGPYLKSLGFEWRVAENPVEPRAPFLIGQYMEDPALPTVLTYGHGDTVRAMAGQWRDGLEPWKLIRDGERWYGRGVVDNKGQHTINLAAMGLVLAEEGRLGFNAKAFIEMGEEVGSPGLHEICAREKEALRADVLIASDGPRMTPGRPTIFGGSRGVFNFDLSLNPREGGHHSGNWGGLLANPGVILANAIASLIDGRGRIKVAGLKPVRIPDSVKKALAQLEVTGEGGPRIDPEWGEPGLSPAEKVYGWNSMEVLAFECGDPKSPAHAIPPAAWARCHVRFTADTDPAGFPGAIRRHLDDHGFTGVALTVHPLNYGKATRLDPENPWVKWAVESISETTGRKPDFLPNLGGTLPNDAFTDGLGLPTIWIPHSYGGCSQHAPNEHALAPIMKEGLTLMTGLFWDLGGGESKIWR
ncbi:MAG: M20 family metallopeptidase [Desulfobacterales bacterium]|nr:M20 family metallopeptidase [Desulfobacterales bacterium]